MSEFAARQKRAQGSHLVSPAKPDRATLRPAHTENPVLAQQQPLGNQAAQRFAESCPLRLPSPSLCPYGGVCHACPAPVQAKLTIGQPGDKYEQEADRVADQVMRMPEPQLQRACPTCDKEQTVQTKPLAARITPLVQRQVKPEEEEEEEESIQTKQADAPSLQVDPRLGAQIRSLRGGGQPLSKSVRDFFEPRFGRSFSQVRVHTGTKAAEPARLANARAFALGHDIVFGTGQYTPGTMEGKKLLAHELTHVAHQTPSVSRARLRILRFPGNGDPTTALSPTAAEPSTEPAPNERTALAFIAEDSVAELAPAQMRKSEFLAELRSAVCRVAEVALEGTGRTTDDCPYIRYWFGHYSTKDSRHIERAIHKYAPETSHATSARDYIPLITERVRRAVAVWAATGEITGVPKGVPTELPGTESTKDMESMPSEPTGVLFKAREGGVREVGNPRTIQIQLGSGRPLDSRVKSRMQSAFGTDFSHVRVHTDARADALTNRLNSRALTVGGHIAFNSQAYRPGTLIGDALIAHELAHTVQQEGVRACDAPLQKGQMGYSSLEEDADLSAVSAILSLWSRAKAGLIDIAQNATPRLRTGLQLQRCHCRTWKGFSICGGSGYRKTVKSQLKRLERVQRQGGLIRQINRARGGRFKSKMTLQEDRDCQSRTQTFIWYNEKACGPKGYTSNPCLGGHPQWYDVDNWVYLFHEIVHSFYNTQDECEVAGLGGAFGRRDYNENRLRCELRIPRRPCYYRDGRCGGPPRCP